MMADALDLLAEIQRSGGNVKLVACDRIKLTAPPALMPALAEKVRAAKPMLLAALAEPGQTPNAPQGSGGGGLNPPRNGATVQHLATAPSADRVIPIPAADWHARHAEALEHWCALYPPGQAAPLAWGELQNRWHRLFGARLPEWQCAGCGAPIGAGERFDTGDGNRVHFDDRHGLDCLISYGARWRGAATRALAAMRLEPPAD